MVELDDVVRLPGRWRVGRSWKTKSCSGSAGGGVVVLVSVGHLDKREVVEFGWKERSVWTDDVEENGVLTGTVGKIHEGRVHGNCLEASLTVVSQTNTMNQLLSDHPRHEHMAFLFSSRITLGQATVRISDLYY